MASSMCNQYYNNVKYTFSLACLPIDGMAWFSWGIKHALSSVIFSVNITSSLLLVTNVTMVRVYCKEAITNIQLTNVTVLVTTSLTSLIMSC